MALELLTAALVIITGFYAWSTFRILQANEAMANYMRDQAEAFSRPYVSASIFVEPDNPIFYLKIANSGRSTALDLQLEMDRSFQQFGQAGSQKDISKFPAFQNKIESFPPGAELIFALAQGFKVFENDEESEGLPWKFLITAKYGFGGNRMKERHLIDLSGYRSSGIPQDPVVRKLKDINESLKEISKHQDGNS